MKVSMRFALLGGIVFAAIIAGAAPISAADFIRGDANNDGQVTASDSYRIADYLFGESTDPLSCLHAGDTNDDGAVDLTDSIYILVALFDGGNPIPAPFPDPGPDPFPHDGPGFDVLDCVSYGGGAGLEDPASEVRILDAEAPGGGDPLVHVIIAVSNPAPIGALLSGEMRPGADLFQLVRAEQTTLGEPDWTKPPLTSAEVTEEVLRFVLFDVGSVHLNRLREHVTVPAGERVPFLEFTACLQPGTPAGEYPLVLMSGELSDPSGRAIRPALAGGTLRVLSDIDPDANCPVPPAPPAGTFGLGIAAGRPGGQAVVPFTIRANFPVYGYAFSIDYDETILEPVGVEAVWPRPDGASYTMSWAIRSWPGPEAEGWTDYLYVDSIISPDGSVALPPFTDNVAAEIRFAVKEGTTATSTDLVFLLNFSPALCCAPPEQDFGEIYVPEVVPILIDGRITVLPDIATFVRADSNDDFRIDLSDAVSTLSFLFLGGREPRCPDAADYNDDGAIDLSDAIGTLQFLFLDGRRHPPAPYPGPGTDPTADFLGCVAEE
jgi:hypothetical protein